MESVKVSQKGIINNILSLNYDEFTSVIEYVNNVITKNDSPNYRISFDMKSVRGGTEIFTFTDYDSIGFSNVKEIESAFSIADSKRSDTNNMGYGIFSPITINKKNQSLALFLQKKETDSLFAIVLFIPDDDDCLKTLTGTYNDSSLFGMDVSELEVPQGTQCIWVSGSTVGLTDEYEVKDPKEIIKFIKLTHRKSLSPQAKNLLSPPEGNYLENNLYEKFISLGKIYYDHLSTKCISFNKQEIKPIDFLGYGLDESRKITFNVESLLTPENRPVYRIKSSIDSTWRKLNKHGIGDEWITNRSSRSHQTQQCEVTIHCLPRPQDNPRQCNKDTPYWETLDRKQMSFERRIYVKLAGTIIFDEEYSKNGYHEIRVIVTLKNEKDNQIDRFISPDANKSNSKINTEFKPRLVSLMTMTTGSKYFGKFLHVQKKKVKKADRKRVWENTHGINSYTAPCYITRCQKILCCMDDWHAGHNQPRAEGGSDLVDNLRPICAECNSAMGTMTIDDYNGL